MVGGKWVVMCAEVDATTHMLRTQQTAQQQTTKELRGRGMMRAHQHTFGQGALYLSITGS
jgi:DnaJ-class molecular chaperone